MACTCGAQSKRRRVAAPRGRFVAIPGARRSSRLRLLFAASHAFAMIVRCMRTPLGTGRACSGALSGQDEPVLRCASSQRDAHASNSAREVLLAARAEGRLPLPCTGQRTAGSGSIARPMRWHITMLQPRTDSRDPRVGSDVPRVATRGTSNEEVRAAPLIAEFDQCACRWEEARCSASSS